MRTHHRSLFIAALILAGSVCQTFAATFTVVNTNSSGTGSLNQAILDANANSGADLIVFNIPKAGPHTIAGTTALAAITDSVVIDGYTQPGASPNTLAVGTNAVLMIELNGAAQPSGSSGLRLNAGRSTIRGLVINRFGTFSGFGVTIASGSANNVIEGCFIGTDVSGSLARPNRGGVQVQGNGNRIGGTTRAARNIISGNTDRGISIGTAANTVIQGNYIGTNGAGNAILGNSTGVYCGSSTPGNVIGGTAAGSGNIISGNVTFGIFHDGTGLVIQGNRIGTNANGSAVLPNQNGIFCGGSFAGTATVIGGSGSASNLIGGNTANGIFISSSSDNVIQGNRIGAALDDTPLGNGANGILISVRVDPSGFPVPPSNNNLIGGSVDLGESNIIAFNGQDGINVAAAANGTGATGNRILANSIHSNGSTPQDLGIDLGTNGITANDNGDPDLGANNLQNFPIITSAAAAGGSVRIKGFLRSAASSTYRIEFFANPEGAPAVVPEGKSFLGFGNVTTNGNGFASFDLTFPGLPDRVVTATATDPNGNTSEFSGGLPIILSPLTMFTKVNVPFVYQYETSGATSLAVNNLPPGLRYDDALRAIVGTPTSTGGFSVSLVASNLAGSTVETLALTVDPVPASGLLIASSTAVTGRTGNPFTFQVISNGGSSATRVSATGLPPGLNIDPVTGVISGTPTEDGSFGVTLTLTNGSAVTSSSLELTFISDPARPVIVSAKEASLAPGQSFNYAIVAPATSAPGDDTTFAMIGSLPPGLGFDPATGTISGTFTGSAQDPRIKPLSGGIITNVQLFATNSSGTGTSPLVFFLVPSGVVNIATRLAIGTNENVLIGGFIITGNAPKKLIIRAIGPSIGRENPTPGLLQDPTLQLREGDGTLLGENDDWRSAQEQEIINTTIPPQDEKESALVATVNPGSYTAIVGGKDNGTGIGLVEVYDLGTVSVEASDAAKLANLSTRGFVQAGDNVMIGGFIASGASTKVVVRAIGPTLVLSGINSALADTTLDFVNGNGSLIIANDDWRVGGQEQQLIAVNLDPKDDRESAVVATINPGNYTAVVRGKNDTTGVALVEVYVLQ